VSVRLKSRNTPREKVPRVHLLRSPSDACNLWTFLLSRKTRQPKHVARAGQLFTCARSSHAGESAKKEIRMQYKPADTAIAVGLFAACVSTQSTEQLPTPVGSTDHSPR